MPIIPSTPPFSSSSSSTRLTSERKPKHTHYPSARQVQPPLSNSASTDSFLSTANSSCTSPSDNEEHSQTRTEGQAEAKAKAGSASSLVTSSLAPASPEPQGSKSTIRQRQAHSRNQPLSLESPTMFTSRKYSPLPTSSGAQRKRAGGSMPGWKRWALVGGGVTLVVLAFGFTGVGKKANGVVWDEESE
jgi:hypothetical protein